MLADPRARKRKRRGELAVKQVYCGPVLRHSAGAIQAANIKSAVAF